MAKKKAAITEKDRAPMCKICNPPRRHWKREGHQFPKDKPRKPKLIK